MKTKEQNLINYIESIKDWLKNLAEDRTLPMDVKVHEALWHQIQAIDHDMQTRFTGMKHWETKTIKLYEIKELAKTWESGFEFIGFNLLKELGIEDKKKQHPMIINREEIVGSGDLYYKD